MIISELVHNNLRAAESRISTKKGRGSAEGRGLWLRRCRPWCRWVGTARCTVWGYITRIPARSKSPSSLNELTRSCTTHRRERGPIRTKGLRIPTATSASSRLRPRPALPSPNRDSVYTSMPNLRDSPFSESSLDVDQDLSPSKNSPSEDVYYKSMPDLGSGQQLHAYYQISRDSSEGLVIPVSKDACVPEGDVREGQMQLVTSL